MRMPANLLFAGILSAFFASSATAQEYKGTKVTQVYEHEVPGLPDKVVRGILVEYEPGGVNAPHTTQSPH